MPDDLWTWWRENLWAGWSVLALGLAAAEMLTLDLTLLMLASGAAAGALTALVFPGLIVVQVLVAVVVAVLMLFLLRPTLLERVRRMPGYRSGVQKLVGSAGSVVAEITSDSGEVKVDGQVWRARPVDSLMKLPVGTPVDVYEVDGITLVVYPTEH